ncbi:MAG: J domain-containing protein, partial [Firmicutes bacterium]|nr:J domain-containing protein [Bacillota bacterium]
ATVNLTFVESAKGAKKNVTVTRQKSCSDCGGKGARSESDFTVCSQCRGTGQVRKTMNTFLGAMSSVQTCTVCRGQGKTIKHACNTCKGKGQTMSSETISIDIPAGIADGQAIQYAGGGNAGSKPGYEGNLNITVKVAEHPLLKRKGFDLHLKLFVPFTTMMLGGDIKIPTVEGFLNLRIDANTQTGTLLKERNKGIKKLNGIGHGDLIIELVAEFPRSASKQIKKEIESVMKTLSQTEFDGYRKYLDTLNKL